MIMASVMKELSTKEVSFYFFEIKQEEYFQNNVRKTNTGTVRVGRKWQVSDIVKAILIEAKQHLRHHSRVQIYQKFYRE